MPANVETAAFANTPAWHQEGVVLDTDGKKGMTVEQALDASSLDWTVEKVPIFGFAPAKISEDGKVLDGAKPIPIQGRYGVQRQSDNKILGVVGKTWQPVQNQDGFDIIEDVIREAGGKVWIEAAGALDGGRKVWILAHVDSDMQIAGEKYAQYLAFVNGHDGRTSVTAMTQDVRIVCQNTLDWATTKAEKANKIVRVRHTTKAAERIKEAHTILGMRDLRSEELAKQGEWLVEQSFTDGEFDEFLKELLPVAEEDTPAATMIEQRRELVAGVYNGAKNLDPIRGTKWGALQAVTEYADHGREFKSPETQLKAQWGITPAAIKSTAAGLLLPN